MWQNVRSAGIELLRPRTKRIYLLYLRPHCDWRLKPKFTLNATRVGAAATRAPKYAAEWRGKPVSPAARAFSNILWECWRGKKGLASVWSFSGATLPGTCPQPVCRASCSCHTSKEVPEWQQTTLQNPQRRPVVACRDRGGRP